MHIWQCRICNTSKRHIKWSRYLFGMLYIENWLCQGKNDQISFYHGYPWYLLCIEIIWFNLCRAYINMISRFYIYIYFLAFCKINKRWRWRFVFDGTTDYTTNDFYIKSIVCLYKIQNIYKNKKFVNINMLWIASM